MGPRQVGKTTLCKALTAELGIPAQYLDLESERDRRKLKDAYLFLKNYENHCVVLDEIQRMPGLFELLRGMIDEKRTPGRFLFLGSASPALLQQSSETLAGRIAYLELNPFNLLEVKSVQSQQAHWLRGGFPNSVLARSDEESMKWRTDFVRSYLERDLRALGLGADPMVVRRFWKMLAAWNGSIWKAESLASSLGISAVTVKKYLDFLENAFLLTVLPPWHGKIEKRLVKAPKVYVRDSGLLHALLQLDFFEELSAHPLLGMSWEGYAIEQIRQAVGERLSCHFYRTHHGAECDLVLAKGDTAVAAIEIKYSSAPDVTKGFYHSVADLDTRHNYVVIPSEEDYPHRADVQVTGLLPFLERHLPDLMGRGNGGA